MRRRYMAGVRSDYATPRLNERLGIIIKDYLWEVLYYNCTFESKTKEESEFVDYSN